MEEINTKHILKAENNPELFAAIYTRKSSQNESHSLDAQFQTSMEELYKRNLTLFKRYDDEISAQAPLEKRKGFSELKKDAEKGLFKTVIIFKRDRLARNFSHWLELKNFFSKHQIQLICSDTGSLISDRSDPFSDFVDNILFATAELEPEILSERTRNGIKKKREKAEYYSANEAYGYDRIYESEEARKRIDQLGYLKQLVENNILTKCSMNSTEDKKDKVFKSYINKIVNRKSVYIPDPIKAGFIQNIFNIYLKDVQKNSILRHTLNAINAEKKKIEGDDYQAFDSSGVHRILKNPTYCGLRYTVPLKELDIVNDLFIIDKATGQISIDDKILQQSNTIIPIVAPNIWIEAMIKWRTHYSSKSKTSPTNEPYLLKGLLFCKHCQSNRRKQKSINLRENYYICSTTDCFKSDKKVLEECIAKAIIDNFFTEKILSNNLQNRIKLIKNNLRSKEDIFYKKTIKQEKIFLKYLNNPKDRLLEQEYKSMAEEIASIQKEIDIYKQQIEHLINYKQQLPRQMQAYNKQKLTISFLENQSLARELLNLLIEKVVLDKNSHDRTCEIFQKGYSCLYKSINN